MTKRWGDLDAANSELESEWTVTFSGGQIDNYNPPITVNVKGNNIGTLSYEWKGDMYYSYNGGMDEPSIIKENMFTDVKTNTISLNDLTKYYHQPKGWIEGTCKITNTYKGISHSITVNYKIDMPQTWG